MNFWAAPDFDFGAPIVYYLGGVLGPNVPSRCCVCWSPDARSLLYSGLFVLEQNRLTCAFEIPFFVVWCVSGRAAWQGYLYGAGGGISTQALDRNGKSQGNLGQDMGRLVPAKVSICRTRCHTKTPKGIIKSHLVSSLYRATNWIGKGCSKVYQYHVRV